jgi:hypothetical protein
MSSREPASKSPPPLPTRADASAVAAVVLGLCAAWVAAGSAGLLGHTLRLALTWVLLLASVVLAAPGSLLWPVLLASAAGLAATAAHDAAVNSFAAVFVLTALAARTADRELFSAAAFAAFVFTIYRVLVTSVPFLWVLADRMGHSLGVVAGAASGRGLEVGPTFAGVDHLVLMAAWYAAWLVLSPPPRRHRALFGALGILAAHACYLLIVAFAADALGALPKVDPKAEVTTWASVARHAIPWNLPAVGVLLHALVLAAMARWVPWLPRERPAGTRAGTAMAAVSLAAIAALACTLCTGRASLENRRVVFYEEGFLNWEKPKHGDYGRLSIGMYGMLPHFLRSLGAECVVSPALSEEDLRGAAVLVLLYPDKPWDAGQLDRITRFVNGGGSLWVLGEHTVKEEDGGSRFNDLLVPAGIEVQFDSATFTIGGWLQSYEMLAHPTTLGMGDDHNQLGIVIGASLRTRWPARPVVIGRWGWSDRGDPGGNAMMGDHAYNAGEQLGDLVLVAERRVGKGKVIGFGDTSSLSNGINMGSHLFNSRMFAYLAGGLRGPQETWRGLVGTAAAAALILLVWRRSAPGTAVLSLAVLGLLRVVCAQAAYRANDVCPDGRRLTDMQLAYVDASHLGGYSGESWRSEGLMGLALNLMRNGYLTLTLSEFDDARIQKAHLFVTVAPARPYSDSERDTLRRFVEGGGTLIATAGYDSREPLAPLLSDLGLQIGDGTEAAGPFPGPIPMGYFKAPFYQTSNYMNYVRFHAAWPVHNSARDAQVLAYGKGDQPTILVRRVGQGKVMVVGDASFAMNKNLEIESGQAFEGMRENPHFWRWLITYLRDQPLWIPPNPSVPEGREEEPAAIAAPQIAPVAAGGGAPPEAGAGAPMEGVP